GGSFAEAGGDQFHFSGVMDDVAGGINAGNVGFHFRIDQDGPFFNVQAPVLDRAQGGDETEADDHCIRFHFFRFAGLFVYDDHFLDLFLPVEGLDFPGSDDPDAGFHHLFYAVFVGAETVPAVNQGDAFGNRFQHQGPIDGGIAATGNQHFFSGKLLHVVDKIIKSFSFKAFRLGQVQFARFKGAASRRDDDRPGKVDLFGGG